MPLLKRIVRLGKDTRGVSLPAEWFAYWARVRGKEVTEVEMDLNDVITLRPVFPTHEVSKASVELQNLEYRQ